MASPAVWNPIEAYWTAEEMVRNRSLAREVKECYKAAHPNGRDPSNGDVTSWVKSVYAMAAALTDAGLGKVWMFVEYKVESMDPVDVVLAGRYPGGGLSFAAIELKQWTAVDRPDPAVRQGLCDPCKAAGPGALCQQCAIGRVYLAAYGKHKKHPSVQVSDNLAKLMMHHAMLDDRYVNLVGAAYLHNLKSEDCQWISRVAPCPGVPTFTARQPFELRKFLQANFSPESDAEAAQELLRRRRAVSLLTADAGAVVHGHTRFSLVGNQSAAVREVMYSLRNRSSHGPKKVFVVSGRPGTGKSLVALTLLGQALDDDYDACFVSGGIAARENFKRACRGRGNAFTTLNHIADSRGADELDLLLCDETHRFSVRPMTGSYSMRAGESSVSVAVTRAKVPVFFIDGDQRLFPSELCTPEALADEILQLGAEIVPITLDRVLRAVGSATYDTWVQRFLAGRPLPWDAGDEADPDPFELCYANSAEKMEQFLSAKDSAGATARISAGMCWPWSDMNPDGTLVPDVRIRGWARPWNASDAHDIKGVPKRRYWATGPGGFGQIGCVHTAQGLEYEWGGVIMGPDLTWDGDKWTVHREQVRSKAARISSDEDLSRAIRNAYGVLMTRSIRGTVLFSTDPATRQLFADRRIPKI